MGLIGFLYKFCQRKHQAMFHEFLSEKVQGTFPLLALRINTTKCFETHLILYSYPKKMLYFSLSIIIAVPCIIELEHLLLVDKPS